MVLLGGGKKREGRVLWGLGRESRVRSGGGAYRRRVGGVLGDGAWSGALVEVVELHLQAGAGHQSPHPLRPPLDAVEAGAPLGWLDI